ncbi:MAG: MFS transporter [Bacteroidales bacterium]|jgi:MFS family permease|nr:MFS transporter [Bacteroidales bacterium]
MLTKADSKHNFRALIFHAAFLSFAQVFIDVDTVIPAMLVDAGGTAFQVGLLTAIMLGGASFTQLIFAPFISNHSFKKKFLLLGINARILALVFLAWLLFASAKAAPENSILLIFMLIAVFAVGGAFANISYVDIMGKSLLPESRKSFFSIRLILNGLMFLTAATFAAGLLKISAYPRNYAWMFVVGFSALTIASIGFWRLKELVPSRLQISSFKAYVRLFKTELRENPKLPAFLGFINTQGISISFLPFVILYAKDMLEGEAGTTGSFLVFKIIGSVGAGVSLFLLAGKFKYKWLLIGNALLAATLPLTLLLFNVNAPLQFVFLLGGIVFAVYQVSMNGVLLEVSGTGNRAIYTGITGAGNILPAIFPLLGGLVIQYFGFEIFFISYLLVVLVSIYFAQKIRCEK